MWHVSSPAKCHTKSKRTTKMFKVANAGAFERHRAKCKLHKESAFSASLAYVVHDSSPDPASADNWVLSLLLATMLGYLYTRRFDLTVLGFLVHYMFDHVVFVAWSSWSHNKYHSIAKTHSRDTPQFFDPIVFSLALFTTWYTFDYGAWAGSLPSHSALPVSYIAVVLACSISGHARLYWVGAIILTAVVWLVYIFERANNPNTHARSELTRAGAATAIVLFQHCIGFVQPVAGWFFHNALVSLLVQLWVVSVMCFIAAHRAYIATE